MESIKLFIEWAATGIEVGTVALILIATVFGSARFMFHMNGKVGDAYARYKTHLGKMLILALEFMVAADIIRTVALEQTIQNVLVLAILVVVRTFLSWSLSVEIEGCWPWARRDAEEGSKEGA